MSPVLFDTLEPRVMLSSTLYVGAGQTYTTIQQAFNAVNAGDTIVVKAGTYREVATLSKSGTASENITVRGEEGNSSVVVEGEIILNGSYLHLEGLTMEGYYNSTYRDSPGIFIQGGSNNEIARMQIQNYKQWGIKSYGSYGHYTDNYIYNCAAGMKPSTGDLIERNTIERLNRHGSTNDVDAPVDYFRVYSPNITIRDNYCFGSVAEERGGMHLDFVQSWDIYDCYNVVLESNVIHGFLNQGIMINYNDVGGSVHDWTIRNNIFTGFTGSGIQTIRAANFLIENNLFYTNATNAQYGVWFRGEDGSGVVRNNICIGCDAGGVVKEDPATQDRDYNLFYQSYQSSLSSHDLVADPQCVDIANFNFRLTSASPAINTGQTRSFSTDLEDNPRPINGYFDIGPYEYGITPTLLKEAENLVVHDSSGDAHDIYIDTTASGDEGAAYRSNAVGDYVSLQIPFPTPGTYNLAVRVKKGPNRGIVQMSLGTPGAGYINVGSPVDLYSSSYQYVDINIGQITVEDGGVRYLKFTVTGKNSSATSYQMVLDAVKLTPSLVTAGEDIYVATHDAYVRDGSYASTNFGNATTLEVKKSSTTGYNRIAYLKFDVTDAINVATATLRLNLASHGTADAPIAVYSCADTSWTESSITWNTRPAEGSLLDTVTVSASAVNGTWFEWDVSSYVHQKVADGYNYVTLVLMGTVSNVSQAYAYFTSTEGGSVDPYLAITESAGTSVFASDDAYVRGGTYADTNYGSDGTLLVKDSTTSSYDRKTYLKFDLSDYFSGVTSAILRLYGNVTEGTSPVAINAYTVSSDSWNESSITWNTAPTTGTLAGSVTVTTSLQWYEIDLTSYVNSQISGDGILTIALTTSANQTVTFQSSEGTQAPELLIA